MTPEEIVTRFGYLSARRRVVEQQWDDIRELVVPYRGDMFLREHANETSVDWRENRNVFDSTAVMACQSLASSIHGSLTSPATQWFGLRFRQEELNDDTEVQEWLDETSDRAYQALQDSDFNLEASEMYLDLSSFGTAIIVEEEEDQEAWEGLDFQAIPVKECFFEEDYKGGIKRLYRRLRWTAVQIQSKFGDKIPEKVKDQLKTGASVETRHEVIFCIYKREEYKDADVSKPIAVEKRPYGCKYVFNDTQEQVGEESGYYEMPAFAVRWRKTSGSQWGNSPAMLALPDIKTLNALVELRIGAAERVVDPATLISERSYFGELDLTAGTQNVVKDVDGVRPYESGARFDVTFEVENQYRSAIRSIFYADQLELKESPAMTATEVQVRYELMQRLLGPTLGRLQSDFLDPLIKRTINILYRAGELPEMPKAIQALQGELDIEYVGPLTRAQKADKISVIDRWIAGQAEQIEISQGQSVDIVDWDKVGRERGEALGVPAKLMRSEADVQKLRKQRAEVAQRQVELDQAEQEGRVLKEVGEGQQAMQTGAAA